MFYLDKYGRPHNSNICYISWGGGNPFSGLGGTLGDALNWEGGGTLGDIANVITGSGSPDHLVPQVEDAPEFATQDVAGVKGHEELGDGLQAKQGTDVGIPVIYGKRRTGGILIYQEVQEDEGADPTEVVNLFQCWALCEGEVQGWELFVDDVSLKDSIYRTLDNSNNLLNRDHNWLICTNPQGDGTDLDYIQGWPNLNGTSHGSDAGIAYPYEAGGIRVAGKSWGGTDNGASHKMKGIACEQVIYRHHWEGVAASGNFGNTAPFGPATGDVTFDEGTFGADWEPKGVDVWKRGLPKLAFEVTGKRIRDNNGVNKETTDPAWILYDYLTNERYGCGIPADEIDATSFATASDICAKSGLDHKGDSIRRHDCNIILDTLQPTLTNVRRILATCNGRLHWINGLYTMKIDDTYSGSGEFNFLEKHIIGGIQIVGDSVGTRLNQVTAKFINPNNKWKSDEVRYPDKNGHSTIYNTFLSNDNGIQHHKTINVGGVTNVDQAFYLAKQACLRSRDSLKVSFQTTAEAMNVVVGDVVTITHSTLAWDAKEFIVRTLVLNNDGTCSLTCIEHNDSIYTWDTNATADAEAPNTNLPDITSVTAPIGLTVEESTYSSISSAGVRIAANLEWTSKGIFTNSHDVQYKKKTEGKVTKQFGYNQDIVFSAKNHGFPENMPIAFTASDTGQTHGVLPTGIAEGVTYYVRPGITGGDGTYILTGVKNNFRIALTANGDNIGPFPGGNYNVYGVGHHVYDPTPTWVDAGNTVSTSMLLQDFSRGVFDFRVRAKNAVGATSDWLTLEDVELKGTTLTPQDVTGFTVANHGSNAVITIDPPTDSTDISHATVRVLQTGSILWEDAIEVGQIAVGNTTTTVPVIDGKYVAKWVNSGGLESDTYLDTDTITSHGSELVATFPEQELWAGTMDGFYETVDDGDDVLRFLGGALIDSVAEVMDTWVPTIDELGGRTQPAIYTGVKRDLGAVLPARIHTHKIFTSLVTDGSNNMDYWGKVDLRPAWEDVKQLDNLTVESRVTGDDPASGGATWTDWKEFLIIDVVARGIQIRVTFDDFDSNSQFTLRELELKVDMVPRSESDRAKTSSSITYTNPFYIVPDLVVTPTNMATGDYMTISSESKTGFNVNFYNSSAVSQTRNYNYIARGV